MLIIKTVHGNFGNFKDLYRFMKEENLKTINVNAEYIFDKVSCQTLSLLEVYNLSMNEVK